MLKGSMPTSELNSKRIPFPQNPLAFSQTLTGPSILMGDFNTLVETMSQTLRTFSFMFSSIHMIPHSQDISIRQRHSTKSDNITTGQDFPFMSKTTAKCVPLVPTSNLCTTNPTNFSSNFQYQEALEFYLHGFHRECWKYTNYHIRPDKA